jgi:hypothetical protein
MSAMGSVLNIFKAKRTFDHPSVGRLILVDGVWQTDAPPPPLDSRGRLWFDSGAAEPSQAQLAAFQALAGSYLTKLHAISEALCEEYRAAQESYQLLFAHSPAAVLGVTRLMEIGILQDCSLTLAYPLYFYHESSKVFELLDHHLTVVMREGQIEDVEFVG